MKMVTVQGLQRRGHIGRGWARGGGVLDTPHTYTQLGVQGFTTPELAWFSDRRVSEFLGSTSPREVATAHRR